MQALRVRRLTQLALVRQRCCFSTSAAASPALLQHVSLDRLALQGKLQVQISDRALTSVEIVPVLAASEFALKAFGASSRAGADIFDVTQEPSASNDDSSSDAIASVRIAKRAMSSDEDDATTLQLFVPHLIDLNVSVARGDVTLRDKIEGDVKVTVGDGAICAHKLRGTAISLKTNRGAIAIASLLEGEKVALAANTVTCKRLMAGATDIKLHKSTSASPSDFGAIYSSACVVTSQATDALTVGNVHGYLRIVGDDMTHVAVHSVNGALDLEDSGRRCRALVHFDSWTDDAQSSIVVGGDVTVSVEPTAPLAVELHGRTIATDGCAFTTHEHEQLDDDYAIVSGTLAPVASSSSSASSGKINVGRAKSAAMTTSFFMADDSSSSSGDAPHARLLVHATGGSVQLEQLDWMAKLKRKHLKQ